MKNIYDLLPENISDETAYYLVNFFMQLALELESHYFAQTTRYIEDNVPCYPDYLEDNLDDELPF
jgi:hypothetical protein